MRLSCSTNRIHPAGRTFLYGLLLWVMPAQGAELGRLFTTPQERAMLEKSRHRPTPQVEKQPKRIEKKPRGSAVEEIKAPPVLRSMEWSPALMGPVRYGSMV